MDWKAIRSKLKTVHLDEHQKDVADDLDLLGKSSLFQFVSMAGTTIGVRTLAAWLTGVADAEVVQVNCECARCAAREDDAMLAQRPGGRAREADNPVLPNALAVCDSGTGTLVAAKLIHPGAGPEQRAGLLSLSS